MHLPKVYCVLDPLAAAGETRVNRDPASKCVLTHGRDGDVNRAVDTATVCVFTSWKRDTANHCDFSHPCNKNLLQLFGKLMQCLET